MLSAFHSISDRTLRTVQHVCAEGSQDRLILQNAGDWRII